MVSILLPPTQPASHQTTLSKFTPVSEKVIVPSDEVDNMAQVIKTEHLNKWCKVTVNNRKPDLCLLVSCQVRPPILLRSVSPLLNCRYSCLFAPEGSMCLDQRPVHTHPFPQNSRILVQSIFFFVGQKNFIARFLS